MSDVLLVSRLATVRAGLRSVVASTPGLHIVGEAALLDAPTADRMAATDGSGVVLLDATTVDEIDDAAAVLTASGAGSEPGAGLVALGPPGSLERLVLTAPPFAWAVLDREAPVERIVAAVCAVAAGLVAYEAEAQRERAVAGPELPRDASETGALTPREHEVLALVALGLTNRAVAQRLGVSEHTVKFHVASILAKLAAESRTEAVNVAVRRGLLAL